MARVYRSLKVSQQYFSISLLMCQPFQGMLQLHLGLCLHNFPLMKSNPRRGRLRELQEAEIPLWALALTLRRWCGPGQPFPEQTPSTIAASSKHKEREGGTVLITPEFAGRFGLWYCKSPGQREAKISVYSNKITLKHGIGGV